MIIFESLLKQVVFFPSFCSNKYGLEHKIEPQIKFSLSKSLIYTILTNYIMSRKSIKNGAFKELFPQNWAELEIKCQVKHIFPQKILSYIALCNNRNTVDAVLQHMVSILLLLLCCTVQLLFLPPVNTFIFSIINWPC